MHFDDEDIIIDWSHAAWGWETWKGAPARYRSEAFRLRHLHSLSQVIEMVALHEGILVPGVIARASHQWHLDKQARDLCYHLRDFGFETENLKSLFRGVNILSYWDRYKDLIPRYDSPEARQIVGDDLGPFYSEAFERLNLFSQQLATADFASQNGLAFCPYQGLQSNPFIECIAHVNSKVTVPLYKAYHALWHALSNDTKELLRSGRTYPLPLPPIAALVYHRAKSPASIAAELIAVREEISKARKALARYKRVVLDHNEPLAKALDAKVQLDNIFRSLRMPFRQDRVGLHTWSDVLSLPKDLFDGIDSKDFESASLVKLLLGKPLKLPVEHARRRKVAIFYRVKRNYYLSEIRKDVVRLFGETALE